MKKFILLLVLLCSGLSSFAQQDIMYTRYMFISNMYYNPASTGRVNDPTISLAYRDQWASLLGAPKTLALGFEMPTRDRNAGFGVNLYHDVIGFDRHTGVFGNYAYRIPVGRDFILSLGLKLGFSRINYDYTGIITPEPGEIDPVYTNQKTRWIPKLGSGIFLHNERSYLGLCVPNLAAYRQRLRFKEDNAIVSRHAYLTLGHVLGDEDATLQFKPSIFLKYQHAAPLQVDFCIQTWFKNRIAFGLAYRTGDAFSGIIDVMATPQLMISYAYDYTASDFRGISSGAHEFIAVYTIQRRDIKVPSIHKFSTMSKF
jgi:type IX secretion system PorP/SprF family membrane protein